MTQENDLDPEERLEKAETEAAEYKARAEVAESQLKELRGAGIEASTKAANPTAEQIAAMSMEEYAEWYNKRPKSWRG